MRSIAAAQPSGPYVLCGLTIVPGDRKIDPKIRVPFDTPFGTAEGKPVDTAPGSSFGTGQGMPFGTGQGKPSAPNRSEFAMPAIAPQICAGK